MKTKSAIKSVAVILVIILVCGGLLTCLNYLWSVSDAERTERAIEKIYNDNSVGLISTLSKDECNYETDTGVIETCHKLSNGDYLILATGKKGYSNGKIKLYVAVAIENDLATVKKTVLDSYTGQTLMSKLNSLYDKFIGKTQNDSVEEIVTGATYSSKATSNAVKIALEFVEKITEVN